MAPRSTGCRNCVRRRIKCDEVRPYCDRCRKANLQCDGFRQTLVFVDETRQTFHRLGPLQTGPSATSLAMRQSPRQLSPDFASELAFCRQVGLSAIYEDVYVSHLLDKFFATGVDYEDSFVNRSWMVSCLSRPKEYPTATLALKCLAASFFGRKHSQDSILHDGARSYGQALLALRRTLQDPVRAWSFDALAATTALNQYEHLIFTSRQGWIQHAEGVGKLIEMRGPERFHKWPDRAILEVNKTILIARSLAARKRTFLEEERWRRIHGPREVDEKHYASSLNDIFAKLPGIAETIQDIESSTVDLAQVIDKIEVTTIKIANLIQELEDWYVRFTLKFGRVALETPVERRCGIASDMEGPLFDTCFEFASLEIANAFVNHRAIKIATLEWRQKLANLSWQRGADHEGMLEIPAASVLALDICRSVAYLLQPAHAQAGAFYIMLPARIAYFALPKGSREAQWLAKMLDNAADMSGFEMARNMLNNIPVRKRKVFDGRNVLKYSPAASDSATERVAPSRTRTPQGA